MIAYPHVVPQILGVLAPNAARLSDMARLEDYSVARKLHVLQR